MKRWLLLLLVLAVAGCATTAADAPRPGALRDFLLKDFAASQKNFEAAAARHTAGSPLNVRFTAAAQCMGDRVAELQGLATTHGGEVDGIMSLGSVALIAAAELQEKASGNVGTAACDQVIGGVMRRINGDALRAAPLLILRGGLPLPLAVPPLPGAP